MSFSFDYHPEELKNNFEVNCKRFYQQCTISVMDTIVDPNITFDENGICNYYYDYIKLAENYESPKINREEKLHEIFQKIKNNKGRKKYDSILGLSGGVDSTYLCVLAYKHGLNPLIVHFDNGWNSELAQHNIESIVKKLNFDLYTYVVDWEEFKELQLSYLKASVVDIEVLTDHAFMAVLYEQARKWNIKYVLAGMNYVTEAVLPSYWIYNKGDLQNIINIQNKFGSIPFNKLKTFPTLSVETSLYCKHILKMEVLTPLNYVDYNYDKIKQELIETYNWKDYGGKHFESIWTRFYQGYILPVKFHIDKRKAHLSNLIFSNQITKLKAEEILQKPPYSLDIMAQDYEYIIKKINLTETEFNKLINNKRVEHSYYGTSKKIKEKYPILKVWSSIKNIVRK